MERAEDESMYSEASPYLNPQRRENLSPRLGRGAESMDQAVRVVKRSF
jgi:hypothetical protein